MRFGRYSCLARQQPLSYVDDAGKVFKTSNFIQLTSMIRNHREEHGGDLSSGWLHRFGTAYCEQNPKCISCTDDAPSVKRVVSVGEIATFLRTVAKWAKNGTVVAQAESNRRAAICSTCPLNVKIEGCQPCFRLADKCRALIGDVKTDYDDKLEGCYSCGCNLKVKVHCPSEVIAGSKNNDILPNYCWMKE